MFLLLIIPNDFRRPADSPAHTSIHCESSQLLSHCTHPSSTLSPGYSQLLLQVGIPLTRAICRSQKPLTRTQELSKAGDSPCKSNSAGTESELPANLNRERPSPLPISSGTYGDRTSFPSNENRRARPARPPAEILLRKQWQMPCGHRQCPDSPGISGVSIRPTIICANKYSEFY